MVEKRVRNLRKILNSFRRELEKKIRVEKMILFGSYARGTPRDYSDIDIAVVSPDFRNGGIGDYLFLDHTAREITPLIEAFPYTAKDFKKRRRGSFLDEIIRTGKVV